MIGLQNSASSAALAARPTAAATDIVVFGEQEVRTGAAFVVPAGYEAAGIPGGFAG
jgi:hypothetical protein